MVQKGVWCVALLLAVRMVGCGGSATAPPTPAPLCAGNLNLIFVVSEDLTYQASGDVNPKTANLTNQGLQRSLLMATFLQQQVTGNAECNRRLRARTDDPFANRKQLPRYGGT